MREKLEVPSLAAWKVAKEAKVTGVSAPRSKPSVDEPQLWSKSTWEMEVDSGGVGLENLLLEVDDAVKKGLLTAADKINEKALKDTLKRVNYLHLPWLSTTRSNQGLPRRNCDLGVT